MARDDVRRLVNALGTAGECGLRWRLFRLCTDPSLLSSEKPVRQLYLEARAQLGKAQEELKALRALPAAPGAKADESKTVADLRNELKVVHDCAADLERNLHDTSALLTDSNTHVTALESELAGLKTPSGEAPSPTSSTLAEAPGNNKSSATLPWFFASSFFVVLLGLALGGYAVDWFIRKRHGGFRIY